MKFWLLTNKKYINYSRFSRCSSFWAYFCKGMLFFVYISFEHIAIKDIIGTVGLDLFSNMQWSKWQLPQLAWYAGYGEQQCVILSAKLAYNILHYFFFRQQLVFSLSPFDLGFDFFVPYQYFLPRYCVDVS